MARIPTPDCEIGNAAVAACVQAGTVQGVVLEQASGRPLARTVVRLDPVPGATKSPSLTTRAGRSGQFVFPAIAPGFYLLVAVRDGYFPAAYGQRLPIGRGTPIQVTRDSAQNRMAFWLPDGRSIAFQRDAFMPSAVASCLSPLPGTCTD
jgi:hypothetical protein